MATQAETLGDSGARLTAPATLVPLLLLALVTTMGFTALGSFGTIQESAKAELAPSPWVKASASSLSASSALALS